jgi:hypothetical protein
MFNIFFNPYIVLDPEKHNLSAEDQLNQTHFFAIFLTFVMYTTHIRATFVQNVKKLKIDLPYCIYCSSTPNKHTAIIRTIIHSTTFLTNSCRTVLEFS